MAGGESSSVPVVQMLSERHDVNAITHWLTEWIRAGAPTPKEVVSDFLWLCSELWSRLLLLILILRPTSMSVVESYSVDSQQKSHLVLCGLMLHTA